MRSQIIIYISLTIVIITNIFHLLQEAQKIHETNVASPQILVWNGGSSCYFGEYPVKFTIPDCQKHTAGEVLEIALGERIMRYSSDSNQKSAILGSLLRFLSSGETSMSPTWLAQQEFAVESVSRIDPSRFSTLWWVSSLANRAHRLREIVLQPLDLLPSDQRLLARKLLIGSLEKLSKYQTEQLQVLGISHVFAVSGFHVSLFFALVTHLFSRLGKVFRFQIGIGVGVFMLLLAGTAASIVRAVLMLILVQWARTNGRKVSLVRVVFFSVLVTLCMKSTWLWDIGWQLSFAAMVALVWLQPELEMAIKRIVLKLSRSHTKFSSTSKIVLQPIERAQSSLFFRVITESGNALKSSIVVMIALLPLLFWHFTTISLGSIILMGVGWWLFPLVFSSLIIGLLVGYTALSGIVYPSIITILSVILLQLPLVALSGLLMTSEFFSRLVIDPTSHLVLVLSCYILLALLLFWSNRQRKQMPAQLAERSQFSLATQGLY